MWSTIGKEIKLEDICATIHLKMAQNPWNVESVMDFNFFCCPECDFQSRTVDLFEAHALDSHVQSKIFFMKDGDSLQDDGLYGLE